MIFKNREHAGRKLAEVIRPKIVKGEKGIILALPRGGVVLGAEVSKALGWPLDIIVTRKIGAPLNPEYAVAAVSEHELIISPRENPDSWHLAEQTQKERQEITRRQKEYRGDRAEINLKNQTVILVDDGLATGLTMAVAISEVRRGGPRRIILAVPVAPPETVANLKSQVDEFIVLSAEPNFFAVGQFYENFPQVTDLEVKDLLRDY